MSDDAVKSKAVFFLVFLLLLVLFSAVARAQPVFLVEMAMFPDADVQPALAVKA